MRTLTVATLLLALAGCRATVPAETRLDPFVRVVGPSGADTTLAAMLDELAGADVVFLGETHLDDVTHEVERAVLVGLAQRRGGRAVLAMEMFATDVQGHLDDYLAGRIDEAQFRQRARPWRNYQTGYRALVETARAGGLPVVGSNIPAELRRRISEGGAEAFASLTPAERALLPPEIHPIDPAYWARFERAVAGHMGRGDVPSTPDPQAYLWGAQSLWDNTMGWSCARALEQHPGHVVLHVNGGFHSKYGQGTVEQLRRRRPGAKVATVSIVPARDLHAVDLREAGRAADFLVFAEARGRGVQEGFHAVSAQREVRYRVRVPESATPEAPVPLLIWLPEEGLRAADGEDYWAAALGDEAAVFTVEPPYTQVEDDLHLGGRWYWTETFHDDVGASVQALERILDYAGRHFPVDAARAAIAGAGTGATVVVTAAVHSDRLPVTMVALEPRQTSKLAEQGLPDVPPVTQRLVVLSSPSGAGEWEARCRGYRSVGLDARVTQMESDGRREVESLVRAALELSPRPAASGRPVTLVALAGSPLGRHWARVCARRLEREGAEVEVVPLDRLDERPDTEIRVLGFRHELPAELPEGAALLSVADFRDARNLPVPAGPFGGTTLLVVPAGAGADERAGWRDLAASEAMRQAHGRFHRLVVAFEDEAPRLAEALADLEARGRRNVLIVPGVFCAEAAVMRRLREQTREHEDRMTLSWLPGLGGSLAPEALRPFAGGFEDALVLAKTDPRTLVSRLIDALGAPDPAVYHRAAYVLRHVTGEHHGFRSFAPAEERAAAQHAWAVWWAEARAGFEPRAVPVEHSTLIVDEMPGRLTGNDEDPPGRVVLLDRSGRPLFETWALKMPYDAVRLDEGGYLVNIIRARAVYRVSAAGDVVGRIHVGGYPCSLERLPDGHLLVAGWDDGVPGFVREFDPDGTVVWRLENLRWPWKATRLADGNTLIADAGTNRVFEVSPGGEEVWSVAGLGPEPPELFDALGPVYVQRLDDGNTLVSIRGQSRVVELDPQGRTVWEVGPERLLNQYSAVRLWNGNTLIADGGHFRVIEIDVEGNIVWEYGGIGYPAKAYRY